MTEFTSTAKLRASFFNVPHLSFGRGHEEWEVEVIDFLKQNGVAPRLATTRSEYLHDCAVDFSYEILETLGPIQFRLYSPSQLRKILLDCDVSYVTNHFLDGPLTAALIRLGAGDVPMIVGHHARTDWSTPQIAYHIVSGFFERRLGFYHHAQTFWLKHQLELKGYSRVFRIPNFVDTEIYVPRPRAGQNFRVFCPGGAMPEKGRSLLIEVAQLLGSRHDIEFLVTGRPKMTSSGNVKALGFLPKDQFVRLMAESHAVLLPSEGETFSRSLIQAMACGTPVITADIPEFREITDRQGCLLTKGTPSDYAEALLLLARTFDNRRDEYEGICRAARQRSAYYSAAAVLPALKDAFGSIAEGRIPMDYTADMPALVPDSQAGAPCF